MIAKNKVVCLHYKLNEETEGGDLIEQTYGNEPLKFIFGVGMMIPSFEANIEGKAEGDAFSFTLEPKDAYGLYEEDAVIEVSLDNFKDENGEVDSTKIAIDQPISMQDAQGRSYQGFIIDIDESVVAVDFNHPMAGLTLHFAGEILEVRDATVSELDHGHVH